MQIHRSELAAVWPAVKKLLSEGYSIIPVRDKPEGNFKPKTPYGESWKQYQLEIITEKELWDQMIKYDTTAVAVLGGKVSGNLEIIDIDNKNKPGVESEVFKAIADLFPSLFRSLRIHLTPSGGYHILYKTNGSVPGNQKLAKTDPKKCFIETRGEGGYALAPPSMNYSIYQDVPIPTLTWTERCSIINICRGFNEYVKEEVAQSEKKDDNYYDINPFQHFNNNDDGSALNWKRYGENKQFIWYSRPGGSNNIHAAFLKSKRLYYFFTTNTNFDSERCYQPSTVLSEIQDGGNKKVTYQKLVQLGYGKIKSHIEEKIIKAASNVIPTNLSAEAKERHAIAVKEQLELYPYGVFWDMDEEGNINIDRENLYTVARGLGFRLDEAMQSIVLIKNKVIYRVSDRFFFDSLKKYIRRPEIYSTYEAFVQKAGQFTTGRIELLDEDSILADTKNICYKFYQDIYVRITAEGWTEHSYDELGDKIIWEEQLQKRNLRIGDGGRYVDFLERALEYDTNETYVQAIIGYLSHNFKDESTSYIPVLVERCEDPSKGGGSGKNVFCNLFRGTTTVTSTPGDQIKYDEKVLQSWNGERIFVISDIPRDFRFSFFKELASGSAKVKKLYKNEMIIPVGRMPKFVFQTNYSVETGDGGLARRIVQLEFTDFFTKKKGIDVYYGIHFPLGWTEEDWAGFDGTIIRSVQTWLRQGLKIMSHELAESTWRKQFEHNFRNLLEFIEDRMFEWCEKGEILNDDFNKQLMSYFEEKNISRMYQPTAQKINRALEEYCSNHKIFFQNNVRIRVNGLQFKGRVFSKAPF